MILLFKLASAPLLILGVTLLVRRFGPVVGGLAMGVPLITGPVSVFTAIEQGAPFARDAAVANLVGQVSTCLFCFTFARASRHYGVWVCLSIGVATYFAATVLWSQISWTPAYALGLLIASLVVLSRLLPEGRAKTLAGMPPRWDLPARMIVAAAFVLGITGATRHLGPQLSGLVAPFPVFILILAVFTYLTYGPVAASSMMRSVILGSLSFAAFFVVAVFGLERFDVTLTYCGAAAASISTSGVVYLILHRKFGRRRQ